VLSDNIAAGMQEAASDDSAQDAVMEAEAVASSFLEPDHVQAEVQSQPPAVPMTPSASHRAGPPGTPGTKRKSTDEAGGVRSATRTRLQL
jgi:hypothetical protein